MPSRRTRSGMVTGARLVSPAQVASCPLLAPLVRSCELLCPVAAAHAAVPQRSVEVLAPEQAHSQWMI